MAQPYGRGRGRAAAHSVPTDVSAQQPAAASSSARGVARGVAGRTGGTGDQSERSDKLVETFKNIDIGNGKSRKGNGDGNGVSLGRGGARGLRENTLQVITRPEECVTKQGTSGKPVNLISNYFQLETVTKWVIYQYRVDFNVEEEREGPKRKWLREHAERLGRAYIFDGTMLFTPRRLTQENKPVSLISVRETDNFPVQIDIRFIQELKYGHIVYLQVFNILVRRSLHHLKLQLVNRDYFDAAAAIKVPQYNLEIWPGYITSIRQNERNILMCSEISHKIMRRDTALDLLSECVKQGGDYRLLFQQSVIGEIVLTDYNNKTYRVDDVDFSSNPTSKFQLKNDEEISYLEYYERRYNIRIKDRSQPLLVSRSSARSIRAGMQKLCFLVPELCRMTGLTGRMLENQQLKRALTEYTRINPAERMERLTKFNERLHKTPEIVAELKQWDLTLSKSLLTIPGRELPPENIVAGGGQKYSAGYDGDWTRELRSRPMLRNGTIREWAVIFPSQLKNDVMSFLDSLRRASAGMDFRFPPPRLYECQSDKSPHILLAVEEAVARSRPDIIMFVCPNSRADRYIAIKKKCCVDRGIPSQVILLKSTRSKSLSIATKVAIQINCKVGGTPWTVEIPLQSVMVVGYDVCHDAHSKGKSYGAVVASLNNALSTWFSSVSNHSNGEELSNTLSFDICKALRKFRELNNGALPARIFVYRDGVGEGDIYYVHEHEVNVLKQRLTEIYGGDHWRLGYIIVSKRIGTRLFKGSKNPLPGTIVDDVITLPERYDFFLISQNVNSGTVTPTNYNVISDNLGLRPDQIQRWTYKMTHLYYNWSGTVRVPAPCQYAHKLAFLVGQCLHIQPHPYLDTSLHFL